MGNKTVEEARERVRSAISNSLIDLPTRKLIVNLALAELPKDGAQYDLPIALSALIANGQLRQTEVDRAVFTDELSLSGQLGPIRGVITTIETAKQVGFQTVYIPNANITQAILIEASTIISVRSLKELFLHLKKEEFISLSETIITQPPTSPPQFIIDDARGQTQTKCAPQITAAGANTTFYSLVYPGQAQQWWRGYS